MDNPQHYQPLSHALHPPLAPTAQSTTGMYNAKPTTATNTHREEEEEEEEEEEGDDDDEGLVEDQLNQNEPDNQGSNHSSPRTKPTGAADTLTYQSPQGQESTQQPERKRRPGRPRGSKNRKPRVGAGQGPTKQDHPFYYQGHLPLHPTGTGTAPPQLPDVNAQNQQYYEFQWRVLNLCAEFYGAAEELVKATPALVVAQCYQMGPTSKVDPLIMLNEAKRVCDTLLANPVRLISNPPPPIYPVIPTLFQPQPSPTDASTSASISAPTSKAATASTSPSTVITNPQSFVVSLGAQSTYPPSQYPGIYASALGQYPTTPYYHQYPAYAPPGTTYYGPPQTQQSAAQPQLHASASTTSTAITSTAAAVGGNQGAWSEEETERLKKLAEESKSTGTSGEMEWDWVVHEWGNGRTRHQILIKATSLGLKESSSRGTKRRRDTEDAASPEVPPTPAGDTNNNASAPAAPASPAQSQPTSTPTASPAIQHQQRPQNSTGQTASVSAAPLPTTAASTLPWPMPTVAANTPSPVVAAATVRQDQQQRTSYYRPRPNQVEPSSKPSSGAHHTTTHQYMYQPNGSTSSGPRLTTENGK